MAEIAHEDDDPGWRRGGLAAALVLVIEVAAAALAYARYGWLGVVPVLWLAPAPPLLAMVLAMTVGDRRRRRGPGASDD